MREKEISKLKRHFDSSVVDPGWSATCFTCGHVAVGYETGDLAEEAVLMLCVEGRHQCKTLRELLEAGGL